MKKQILKKIIVGLCVAYFALLNVTMAASALAADDFIAPAVGPGEIAQNMAFDGENYLVAICGDQTNGGRIAAQLLTGDGTPVGPRIDIGRSGNVPGVAFDGDNYLLIWEDLGSTPANLIYGQFIARSGTLIGTPFPLSSAAGVMDPACAISFDGTDYLVAWNDASAKEFCGTVRYRAISRTGALGKETVLSSAPGCYPCISAKQGSFLASWSSGAGDVVRSAMDPAKSAGKPALVGAVQPAATATALDLTMTQDGLAVTLTATLTAGGSPVQGKTVLFYDKPVTGIYAAKGSAVTNASGIAIKKFTSTPGAHAAYAKLNATSDLTASRSADFTYTIAKVTLTSPTNGSVLTAANPDLNWQTYEGASLYHVQVATSSLFSAGTFLVDTDTGNTGTVYSLPLPGLMPGKTYYWRIQAATPNGKSLYSDKRTLIFKPPVNLLLEQVNVNGSTITFKATLARTDTGDPLPGKTIAFYENTGGGAFALKGTAITGSLTGVASKTWTTKPGSHQTYAKFTGNASYAPNSTDPADFLYITYPPVTFVLPSPLKPAIKGMPYYESLVSAANPSGGNGPPYHFVLGTGVGFPPPGITLAPNGVLSGTPTSPPGTKANFTVCAIDSGGNSTCKPTSITMSSNYNPVSTGTWFGTYTVWYKGIPCQNSFSERSDAGHMTLYFTQIGNTVTGTFQTQPDSWFCESYGSPGSRNGHLKGTTYRLTAHPENLYIKWSEIEISGMNFPACASAISNSIPRTLNCSTEAAGVSFVFYVTK